MEKFPPVEFYLAAYFKAKAPKPIAEEIAKVGLPVKKGKVKRGHISR